MTTTREQALEAALLSQMEPRLRGWRVTDWTLRDADALAALALPPSPQPVALARQVPPRH